MAFFMVNSSAASVNVVSFYIFNETKHTMKPKQILFILLITGLVLISCGRPSPKQVAKKYCDIYEKYNNATSDDEKKKLRDDMEAYEKSIKKKYGNDETYQSEIRKEVDECTDRKNR